MTTLNASLPTLLDMVKLKEPDGKIASIVESLSTSNPLLQDMVWKEGNLPTGHVVTSRTGLPSVSWRKFNEGTAASKSRTDQFTEACGMLSGRSNVDCELADLNGDKAAFRLSEDKAFMQALNKEMETGFFYHSTKTAPEKIMGLAPRLDAISGSAFPNQIIDWSGSSSGSDQTSVWLIVWGPDTVFGIYPKGSVGGISAKDMGEQYVLDSGGSNSFRAYSTDWTWKAGLCVKDARYLVRICNIDTSAIAATGHLLLDDMTRALEQVQDLDMGRPAFYCNRTIRTYLRLQATDSVRNSTLAYDNVAGKPVLTFGGVPVRRTDALVNTEAVIS